MLGLGKPKPVAEHEAEGEIERVYHEIRQTLRVTGVNLNFRTWAAFDKFLPAMWDAMRPNAETQAFEDAADHVRADAVRAAEKLGRLDAATQVRLGESQTYQLRAALNLYHYINPKLLVFTSAVQLALSGERIGSSGDRGAGAELIERGAPPKMYPMEMEAEDPDDKRLRELFEDIKQTLSLASINSDYRTLALWPDYLAAAWAQLKPIVHRDEYRRASDALRERARSLARSLPHPVPLSRERVEELGENADAVVKMTDQFERLLPPLILNIGLLELDWQSPEVAVRSPFPAAPRPSLHRQQGGA